MSSVPPPSFQHPGSPPSPPELPEGVQPGPVPAAAATAVPGRDDRWPPFPWWSPIPAAVAALVIALIAYALISVVLEASGTRVDSDRPPTGLTVGATVVQDLALVLCAVLFAGLGGMRPTAAMFGFVRTRLWPAVGWTALALVAFYLVSLVWAAIIGIEESDDLAEELGAKDSTLNMVVVAVLVTLVAPITEEFFFRGFFFPALARRFGVAAGAVGVGIVFGLIHAGGTNPEFLLPLAVFGLLLCLLYWRTRSLLPCIGLHAFNNALALGVTLDWTAWQVALGVVIAPLAVLALSLPLARRVPPVAPAYAA